MADIKALTKLFNSINKPFSQLNSVVGKGSIISFHYVGQTRHQINDPYPLVLVSDIFSDSLRGLNLHYLTYPYMQSLVTQHTNNRFSYAYIKGDSYIVGAFRSYKRNGISQLKMIDTEFIKNSLKVSRALNVGEIEQMREQIRQMLENNQPNQPEAKAGPEIL